MEFVTIFGLNMTLDKTYMIFKIKMTQLYKKFNEHV